MTLLSVLPGQCPVPDPADDRAAWPVTGPAHDERRIPVPADPEVLGDHYVAAGLLQPVRQQTGQESEEQQYGFSKWTLLSDY